MNRSARTAETVSDVYLALMLSAFLLWTGPDGYTKILEAKYRLTVYLYYYEGCTVAEVAAALRANPSTVQTWLLRARERLRRELSGQEEKEGQRYVRPQIIP